MKLKLHFLILFSFLGLTILAQTPELTTIVSKSKLGVNQRLRVEFSINKQGGDNFILPKFRNFTVISGPSQSISQSWINGRSTFNQSYIFILQPKKQGILTIGTASINISGKKIKSKAVKINVTKAVKVPDNPNDPNYIAGQKIHLVAHVNDSSPYVGEAISVEYRLYIKNNINAQIEEIPAAPKYEGFWNQDLNEASSSGEKGMFNGEQYIYYVIYKSLLIPTKSGNLQLEPFRAKLIVEVPVGRSDFFGNRITQTVKKTFSSAKKTIRVKSLPAENKPENFNGAVGDFNYKVKLSKDALKANESAQVKIEVQGKGNLKLFELPKIEATKNLEIYDPERKEKVSTLSYGLRGSIKNTYTIVPQYKGEYKIPSTEFSYFNPKEEKYHTIKSSDLYVNMLEGEDPPKEKETIKGTKNSVGDKFQDIQLKTDFITEQKNRFFNSRLFYVLLIVPFLAIPFAVFIKKKREHRKGDILGNKTKKAERLAKKYLAEANKNLGKKEAFYESLERALHNYLKAKLKVETSEISSLKISELLESRNIKKSTISKFLEVIKDCDFARYTPVTDIEMKSEYNKAKQVIMQLDKQL